MATFPALIASVAIGKLSPSDLGSGSSCLASPSSGGLEFGITVFTPNVVVNYVSSTVLEGTACETLVILPVH